MTTQHLSPLTMLLSRHTRRREFIILVGGAAAWPLTAHAQQTTLPVVGFLNSASAVGYASMAAAFRQGLSETGYVDGTNVSIEYRWADDQYDRLPALATDLVSRRVTAIFANSPSIAAAKAATSTIPIIMMSGDDPVRLGFVASFNRPGGNITGVSILSGELAAKRLELLRELVPHARTIAILINSDFGPSGRFRSDVEGAARALRLPIEFLQANKRT
jgi:putative ABC transport system substrate-binding protein